MKAGIYYSNSDVRVEEMPLPQIGDRDILLRVMASGICGTDIMEWYRKRQAPVVLGHEVAGIVETAGLNVKEFSKGDRAIATHHVPCNECHRCRAGHHTACESLHKTRFEPGGFAEYLKVPAINIEKGGVLKLPENVSFEEATFVEPLACVLRSQRLAGLAKGQSVLILGSGIAGLLHIKAAKAAGAGRVFSTDISGHRLLQAKKIGAMPFNSKGFSVEKLQQANQGRAADLVIVCTSSTTAITRSFGYVEPGGTIVFFASCRPDENVSLPLFGLWKNSVSITTSYAAAPEDLRQALDMISKRKIAVKDLITHRLGLGQIAEGFRLTAQAQGSLKVIIAPHGQ